MTKITFMGAGSTVFAKNVLGDIILNPVLKGSEIALYDIDPQRLKDSEMMIKNLNEKYKGEMKIKSYLGVENRKEALRGAKYVINAIQVGGYKPSTVIDFEIPKKYGLRQTIGDTLGIGGIFRALRTIPVLKEFADDIKDVCPDALFLNYTNPMSILTGALIKFGVKTVGLCHSVQACVPGLLEPLGISTENVQWKIAGINHQAWLLEITRDGKDLYPEIKEKAFNRPTPHNDMVRYEIMRQFGYYVTESSEHNAEYVPWFIKKSHPELIEKYNIPLDEYPRRCENQIKGWNEMRKQLVENKDIEHKKTNEFASYIIEAVETDKPYRIHGNVLNTGLITNLPNEAVVEVPCMVDRNGINPCYVGDLPQQLAAINRMSINVHLLTLEAAFTLKKDYIYMAAMLDPHTGSELTIDEIRAMVDDLIEAHGDWLPKFK
ncbi:MAG: alpha-glucosidase/alpha-galactosidase [Thermoanaerobacter sp.]|uniref:Alpha-galactosidase/6-phospho-beta-glucosidase n=1 Tax=Caldanaerobacter subterraneus subsp. pacificus DSM 12653 TaxID=391606 RepID=B7R6B7_9THEO|nr:alpha-glucosidase/alpha-galactosidase [Caldanaerobacter subterraneus]KKC28764.1 alpha-galactosidase/6-phospho-beta-glucosidase [Caldanaerobacter subterraneus subsp. pacificus DSM 12653]MBE3593351.1 alpha-glucosidase/alpha-galactosidase [Thermoanaerobacter sp.]